MNNKKEINIEDTLAYKLKKYTDTGIYPFHIPGHKRNMPDFIKKALDDVFKIDLTELDYTDDLHRADGIIKEAMDYAKEVYKTKKTYFLVNGSSCGIHTAIKSVKKEGKKILFVKNAHFSAYNAIELNKIEARYVEVEKDEKYEIYLGVDVKEIEKRLEEEDFSALYLTSPTYDGIISDIEELAKICHKKDVLVVVDEAHGAYLQFFDKKMTALYMGADIVIQSLHKTLPALTQTALLHINTDKIELKDVEKNLAIFETSSPSYIFSANIDACIRYSNEMASEDIRIYKENLKKIRENTYKNFEVFDVKKGNFNVKYLDESKLVICIKNQVIDGKKLAKILREEYNIDLEMSKENYILAITTYCDTSEGFERLNFALKDLDKRLDRGLEIEKESTRTQNEEKKKYLSLYINKKLDENIFIYPPGIPILKKGDILKQEDYDRFSKYIDLGYKLVVY